MARTLASILGLSALLAGAATAQQSRADSMRAYERFRPYTEALRLAQQVRDYALERAMLDSIIALGEQSGPVYFQRGTANYNLRDMAAARRDFQRALQLGDNRAAEFLTGMWAKSFDSIAASNPVPPPPVNRSARTLDFYRQHLRAEAAATRSDWPTVRAVSDSVLARDSTYARALYRRGMALGELGDNAAARRDLERAVRGGEFEAESYLATVSSRLHMDSVRAAGAAGATRARPPQPAEPGGSGFPPEWLRYRMDSTRRALTSPAAPYVVGALLLIAVLLALWVKLTPRSNVVELDLDGGEKQLWLGAPRQGFFLGAQDVFAIPFSIVWCYIVSGFAPTALPRRDDLFEWLPLLAFIVFAIAGVILLFGRFFIDARQRKRTTYVLTNKRAISMVGSTIESLPMEKLDDITLDTHRDGTSTIWAAPEIDYRAELAKMRSRPEMQKLLARPEALDTVRQMEAAGSKGHGVRKSRVLFERIADGERVQSLIQSSRGEMAASTPLAAARM